MPFFFSCQRRHKRSLRDWSSDVCSSGLGRIVCCGAASQYDSDIDDVLQPGPTGIPQRLINGSLRMEGFAVADFQSEWAAALEVLSRHLESGALRAAVRIWEGLEHAPDALLAVLAGDSFGQAMVQVAPAPVRGCP